MGRAPGGRGVVFFLLSLLAACGKSSRAPATVGEPQAPAEGTSLVDDHATTVSAANVGDKRQALIDYLWGTSGFPSGMPAVEANIASPIPGLDGLARVDRLHVAMDGGESNTTLHFVAARPNGRLVVVSLGHWCTFADADVDPTSDVGPGYARTIGGLLEEGYDVLGTYMPHMNPQACADVSHGELLERTVAVGHPMKWFVEPIAVSLNALKPLYPEIAMIGLSGGGWTTTLYAALDPTIHLSIPTAGSVPLNLRSGSSIGDAEQNLPELYAIAGYPDLYMLGASGGRRQVQVLNRRDDCCFGQSASEYDQAAHGPWDTAMRAVENQVELGLISMGTAGGFFRLEIDEAADHHSMSWNTIATTILAELDGGARSVGASASSTAFVRTAGTLWSWDAGAWADTKIAMVGAPAVVDGATLFYRSPSNILTTARQANGAWTETSLDARIVTDPVATLAADGTVTVAAVDPQYRPFVWTASQSQSIDTDVRVVGPPGFVADTLLLRGADRHLHVFSGAVHTDLGGALVGFPAAIHSADGSDHVYVRDLQAPGLREISRASSAGAWGPHDMALPTDASPVVLSGSPSASADGGTIHVLTTTRSGSLARFSLDRDLWSAWLVASRVTGSPVSVGDGAFGASAGRLWQFDGDAVERLGSPAVQP